MRRDFYERNESTWHGHARFLDAHTVQVRRGATEPVVRTTDAFVIATGSRPYRPPDIDFDHPRIFDSDTILSSSRHPGARPDLRRRRHRLRVRVASSGTWDARST